MTDQLQTEESIFVQAIEIRNDADRSAFLDQACGDNEKIRGDVEELIRAHGKSGDLLDLSESLDTTAEIAERPGTVIGPYKLLQQIGEGGMGVVFLAEQTHPVQRTVALKIIKPGMDTRQVIARFEAERQALAVMDHPNIAKVLDAGTTDTGRPYFVMELVKGVPITKYCDEKQLSLSERLELVMPVCQAVQHAHQKGIIHRDIKPTNVLVAEYDNCAVPKVIDFGVAKATAQKLTERTMFTEFGQVIGTVEYMSPEQAKLNQLDIDTRSDIYSLGVLLYELLTGSTPFEQKRLREAAFDEVLRIIREEEPPKPSTKLSSSETLPSIAANRHTEPARLSRDVRGELDWIVMKCLEKDRNRRYETANGLAGDIERYLHDEPVHACSPSAAYRFRKFALRNRVALLTGAAILTSLVVGTVVSTWQAFRATRAEAAATAARNEAEANFQKALAAVDEMLSQVGQESLADIPQVEPVRRALLEKALAFYQDFLEARSSDPRVRLETARAHQRVSQIYAMLGGGDSIGASQQAISILEALAAQFPRDPIYREEIARCYQLQAPLLAGYGGDKAREAAHKAFTILTALVAEYPDEPRYAYALSFSTGGLGRGMWGEREDDQPRYGDVKPNKLGQPGRDPSNDKRYEEAAGYYRQAIELHQKTAERFPPATSEVVVLGRLYDDYSVVLRRLGRHDEAEQVLQKAVKVWKTLADTFPANTDYRTALGRIHYRFGELLEVDGRPQSAEPQFREAIAIQESLVQDFPKNQGYRWNLTFTLDDLGQMLRRRGQLEAAQVEFARAAEAYRPTVSYRETGVREFPKEQVYRTLLISAQDRLGALLLDAGHVDEAVAEFHKAVLARERAAADFSDEGRLGVGYCRDQFILAIAYFKLDNKDEARAWYDKAVEWMDKNYLKNEELIRFRAEAAELLGIAKQQPDNVKPPGDQSGTRNDPTPGIETNDNKPLTTK